MMRPGNHGTGCVSKEVGIGAQEIGVHPLVVIDEGHNREPPPAPRLRCGHRDPGPVSADHAQPHAGMCGPKRSEAIPRIVRRIVVYDDTPIHPQWRLPHNRFLSAASSGTARLWVGITSEDANHWTKVSEFFAKMLYLRKFQIKPKSYDHAQTDSRLSADARNRVVRLHGIGAERHMERSSVEPLDGDIYRIVLSKASIPTPYHMYDMGPYEGGPNATTIVITPGEGATPRRRRRAAHRSGTPLRRDVLDGDRHLLRKGAVRAARAPHGRNRRRPRPRSNG